MPDCNALKPIATYCLTRPYCHLYWREIRACGASTASWTIRSDRCHRTPGVRDRQYRTGTGRLPSGEDTAGLYEHNVEVGSEWQRYGTDVWAATYM